MWVWNPENHSELWRQISQVLIQLPWEREGVRGGKEWKVRQEIGLHWKCERRKDREGVVRKVESSYEV